MFHLKILNLDSREWPYKTILQHKEDFIDVINNTMSVQLVFSVGGTDIKIWNVASRISGTKELLRRGRREKRAASFDQYWNELYARACRPVVRECIGSDPPSLQIIDASNNYAILDWDEEEEKKGSQRDLLRTEKRRTIPIYFRLLER